MKHVTRLLFLGLSLLPLSALKAQSVAEKRAYFRLGAAISHSDLKAYLGDRAYSPIYEIGYDFNGPTESTGFGVYASYLTAHGDPIEHYGGLRQVLFGWRFGADMRFRTPIKGLTPFLGFSANFFDGQVRTQGFVPDPNNVSIVNVLEPGSWPESRPKIGARAGVEYRITESWGVVLDFSGATWLSKNTAADTTAAGPNPVPQWVTQRRYQGINPVAPSWINLSVQYRWNITGH